MKSDLISMDLGDPRILLTTALSQSLVEENHTLLQGAYFLCGVGVAVSLLIIRGMMILSGTWERKYERFLEEILTSEDVKNQTIAGIVSWYMKTGNVAESR